MYIYIYYNVIERGASPARAISMQNAGFSEVTFCNPSPQGSCIIDTVGLFLYGCLSVCVHAQKLV